jgi:hypothetical protein
MVVSSTHIVWSVWYMNSTWSQSQMITQLGLLIECISLDPIGVRRFQQIPKLMIHMQVVSSGCIKASKIFHIQKLQRFCWEHLFAREPRQFVQWAKTIFFYCSTLWRFSSTVMFWCTTALMHYSSELFSSHFRCTKSWNIDAEVVVSTNLMGGDSAHSDQDGSLWLNPVLMHSSCSLDLSSFKPRGYPCHGVMGCSTSQ